MSKEQTPITAEELSPFHEIFENNLRAISDNKNRNDLIVVWFRQSMEQYAQAKVEDLQKENKKLKSFTNAWKRLSLHRKGQITQLQKERDELLEGISEIKDMYRLDSVYEKCIDLLTNKKEG